MQLNINLGKKGLSENFISSLKNNFLKYRQIRIYVLKSLTRKREEIEKIAEKISSDLGKKYIYRIIGFTIIINKK